MAIDVPEPQALHPGFGRLLSEHRLSRRRRALTVGAAVFLAVAAVAGLPLTFIINQPGSGAVTIAGCLTMSLAAAGAAWWSWRISRREQGLAVYLYQQGLVQESQDRPLSVRWADIWSVTMAWPSANGGLGPGDVILETAAKERLVLQDPAVRLEASPLLAQTIQQEVARTLTPRVQAAFQAGRWLGFRKFRLSSTGLQRKEQVLPWAGVERIEIAGGRLTIYQRGRWRRWLEAPVEEIPNLLVFARLAEQHSDLTWEG